MIYLSIIHNISSQIIIALRFNGSMYVTWEVLKESLLEVKQPRQVRVVFCIFLHLSANTYYLTRYLFNLNNVRTQTIGSLVTLQSLLFLIVDISIIPILYQELAIKCLIFINLQSLWLIDPKNRVSIVDSSVTLTGFIIKTHVLKHVG